MKCTCLVTHYFKLIFSSSSSSSSSSSFIYFPYTHARTRAHTHTPSVTLQLPYSAVKISFVFLSGNFDVILPNTLQRLH
jgi:pyrrolidone-carboxylate peptidase